MDLNTGPLDWESSDLSCLSLVKDIKEKLKICNEQEMVQLLTIVPDDWSIKKTVKFFNVTEHLVNMA